jgi:anti-anti-sigma factor
VIFDLTELSFLDSAGLQVLLACIRRGGADGSSVHLAAAQGKPARLLQITGIDAHLPVHATVEQAITAVLTSGQSG